MNFGGSISRGRHQQRTPWRSSRRMDSAYVGGKHEQFLKKPPRESQNSDDCSPKSSAPLPASTPSGSRLVVSMGHTEATTSRLARHGSREHSATHRIQRHAPVFPSRHRGSSGPCLTVAEVNVRTDRRRVHVRGSRYKLLFSPKESAHVTLGARPLRDGMPTESTRNGNVDFPLLLIRFSSYPPPSDPCRRRLPQR